MAVQLTFDDIGRAPIATADPQAASPAQSLSKAAQFVIDGLTSCLPPGVPLMGEIISARFIGREKAEATMTMFDGRTGVVEVSKWTPLFAGAWCIAWQDTGNTPCHWNGSVWERLPPEEEWT